VSYYLSVWSSSAGMNKSLWCAILSFLTCYKPRTHAINLLMKVVLCRMKFCECILWGIQITQWFYINRFNLRGNWGGHWSQRATIHQSAIEDHHTLYDNILVIPVVEIWQTIGMSQKDFSNRRIATKMRERTSWSFYAAFAKNGSGRWSFTLSGSDRLPL